MVYASDGDAADRQLGYKIAVGNNFFKLRAVHTHQKYLHHENDQKEKNANRGSRRVQRQSL